jgi:hypothetical protein
MSEAGQAELTEVLRQSQQEQARVTVYFRGSRAEGVVARLDTTTVELREGAERVVVRIDRIDAVRRV